MNLSQAAQPKLIGTLVTILGLLVAVFVGRAVGNGSYMPILLIIGGLVGVLVVLGLGDRYWYLLPLSLGTQLPAIPLGGRTIELPELAIAICTAVFVARVALKKEKPVILRTSHTAIILFMCWVALIYSLNPTGLLLFGAQAAGARFYLKLIMAFCAFIIMASRQISDRDCKWVVWMILIGTVIDMIYGIASYFLGAVTNVQVSLAGDFDGGDDFYTWHQALSGPAIVVSMLIFARWKPTEVLGFQRPLIFFIYIGALILALASGKRMGFIGVMIAPIIAAIIYRQYIYIGVGLMLAGGMALIVILGHGPLFSLPLTAQRTLSWLPADWDPALSGMAGGTDDFREELRRMARKNISKDPIIGRGFAVDISETAAAISAAQYGGGIEIQVAPYALGRAWHNTWLGYSADFGIPLAIIQGILFVTVIAVAYKTSQIIRYPSARLTLVVYILIFTVRDVISSQTSGHSALDAFSRWWMYGALFAIGSQAFMEKAAKKRFSSPPAQGATSQEPAPSPPHIHP